MAQDEPQEDVTGDESHDLDMVAIWSSNGSEAEMEAEIIRSLLDANGIPAVIAGATEIPPAGFQVQVPRSAVEEARRVVTEAQAAGPEAAAEAEAASEE